MVECATSNIRRLGWLSHPFAKLEVLKLYVSDVADVHPDDLVARMVTATRCSNIKHMFLSVCIDYEPYVCLPFLKIPRITVLTLGGLVFVALIGY